MPAQVVEVITKEQLDAHIANAAKAAGYESGFGATGCDLAKPIWWAAYCRQSLDQQLNNNRLPEYLLTEARMAKEHAVVVPREYVLFDHETGEHLERPGMIVLRRLMAGRRISGIVFPALDRLSREPLHQQIFELEAAHYGAQLQYADAPSGNDPGSQFARTILAHAAKLVKLANRRNNRGGNIGRVISRNVPAGKTSYGYKYHAEYQNFEHGRRKLITAYWEVDRPGSGGVLDWGSEAWVVTQVFQWVGNENRTPYWAAKELNRLNIKPRYAKEWSPALVSFIVKNHCYVGRHSYNRGAYVPNPARPLGDLTAEIKRTIRQLKPQSEWVEFEVPVLISEQVWQDANKNLKQRGRGRGKEGRRNDALLRGRVFCPSCGRLLSVYRDSKYAHLIYYTCATRSQGWKRERCRIRSFRVDWLDGVVWDCAAALLKQPGWVERQFTTQKNENHLEELQKRIRLENQKIERSQARINRIQDGYEADHPLYTATEAQERTKAYRDLISRAEEERNRLEGIAKQELVNEKTRDEAFRFLENLRDVNLDSFAFSEKQNLLAKLGIKVYPSEDGKAVRIASILRIKEQSLTISRQKISIASPKE